MHLNCSSSLANHLLQWNIYLFIYLTFASTDNKNVVRSSYCWTTRQTNGTYGSPSHADTVVWECCKDDQQSQWEMLKFYPQLPLNPLSDRHQISRPWLCHGYLSPRKNWAQSVKGFLLPIYAKYTPPCSLRYDTLGLYAGLLLFWYFKSPTAETPAWILTLKTSNDAVLRKEVPFEGYKS